MRKKRIGINDVKLGCIFYVPFMESDQGAFGYVKYESVTRSNPQSLEVPLADIYDRVCRLDEYSDDIKQEKIKIWDIHINAGFFIKAKYNPKPWVMTDHHTNIIHPVKYGFFKVGETKYWYDADAKNIVMPTDINDYRKLIIVFQPYNNEYVEAIFKGHNIKYGDDIPGIEY